MPVLIQIDGYDPVASAAVTLRAGSHDDPAICHAEGETWWPAIGKLPVLRYDLFDGNFGGQIEAPSSSMTVQTEPWPNFGRYMLADARFRLWTGNPATSEAWTLRFDGRVKAQPKVADGTANIDFAVDDRWLDTSLLPVYAGTSGAEGTAALKGQAKPLALGAPRYAPGKLIDSINSVFQLSSVGAVDGFDHALEKLARFAAPVANHASYAALIAATIPPGRWASATAVGMARFGAPPTGQISFLMRGDTSGPDGWARKPGQIARRIALLAGGTGRIDDTTLNALDTARPYNLSLYLDDQVTARPLIQNIAASVNAVAGVSWTGKLFILPVAIGTATITLAADGSALPAVAKVDQVETASPWQKLAISAERAWTVHALSDIAFTAELIDLGAYSSGTTYREGNIVSLADGSRWVYTATTPTSGNTPATGSAFWNNYAAATQPDFASVVGDTKPEDFATRNDDGANMIRSPLTLDEATYTNGAVPATFAGAPAIQLFTTNALGRWGPKVPCRPSETLFHSFLLSSDGPGSETVNASYSYFDASGTALGAVNLSSVAAPSLSSCAGITTTITFSFQVPSTAYFIQIYIERPVASGNSFFARQPYLGRSAPGATVGGVLGVNVVDPVTGTVPTRDEMVPGQVLSDRGIQNGATPGAVIGGNLRDGGGLIVAPDRVLTELGEAASYAGQAVVEQRVFEPKQNRVYNSQFKYGLTGWANSLGTFAFYNDWQGTFMNAPVGVGGLAVATNTKPINTVDNTPCTLSATFKGDASVNQFLFVDVEWRNGGNGALVDYSSTVANLVFWTNIATTGSRKSQPFNSPSSTDGSNFVRGYIRVVTNSDVAVALGELLVTQIQLEAGSLASAYNEGADDGAILSQTTGQIADSRSLNASNTLGLVALSSPGALGDTVISGQLYLTIGAGTYYTDWGATVSYPSATIGPGPFGLTYHIWRNVSGPGDAGSSYDASPTLTNALGVGKVYLGSVVARASAGDPPGSSSNNGDYVDNGGGIFIPN